MNKVLPNSLGGDLGWSIVLTNFPSLYERPQFCRAHFIFIVLIWSFPARNGWIFLFFPLQSGETQTGAGVSLHRGAGWTLVVQHGRHRQSQCQARQVPHPQEYRGPNPADEEAWAGWATHEHAIEAPSTGYLSNPSKPSKYSPEPDLRLYHPQSNQ